MRLIDADALKANVPETRADIFEDCRRCTTLMDWEVKELVDKQPTVAASPWHRVEEPPKEEGKYLVYDGRGNYFVAWWGPRLGWCYDPKFFCYWMPIEPPKEEE